jgi:AraC family transcriptional regulator of adaptative response/methylated-DNA-[protein]-cysteine methyltransferase
MGVTPRAYADQLRLSRLKHRLHKEEDVTTAMYESGYGSPSRLYERSNRQLGMTPATYGRGGRGMEIRYTISESPIGHILVAGTDRGVAAIYMGRSDAELTATLRREYPQAQITRNPESVSRWVRQIVRHLAGRQPQLDLPLDIQGTAFQRRVWEALRGIPYGETRSYTDVARQLGQPKARRAVARACATNPVSLVIPCHRVIRGDGGLGGYGGGIERKQALLASEKRAAHRR